MKTLQIAFLALITTACLISCKKDNDENDSGSTGISGDSGTFTNTYSFGSIQAVINNSEGLVFDQFSKQGNTIIAKQKKYFKREPSSTFNDSIEYILEFEILKSISKVGDYSVTGPEVKASFSYISSVLSPVYPFTHRTIGGTLHVAKIEANKFLIGTFDWEGEIVTATPRTTQKLTHGYFAINY